MKKQIPLRRPNLTVAEVADHVTTLAEAEDLPGHGAAVRVRFSR